MPNHRPPPATMTAGQLAGAIRAEARRLGFDRTGFCDATPPPEVSLFDEWLSEGMDADMRWLRAGRDKRLDPGLVLEGARSVVVVAHAYASPGSSPRQEPDAGTGPHGIVARYARGDDYHTVTGGRLGALERFIESSAPGHRALGYVDTGPVLERMWAAKAGVGWIGKHALVMNEEMGSWFFLGVILTTVALPSDEPLTDRCGSCALCIEACPTAAIVKPGVVDSRRCISYHTIEHRGPIPPADREGIGLRVFGCDDCQEVCPYNAGPGEEGHGAFPQRAGAATPSLVDLLRLEHGKYLDRFRGSAVKRATWKGLRRNAAVALGNTASADAPDGIGAAGAHESLASVAADPAEDPVLRDHARWAARRLEPKDPLD